METYRPCSLFAQNNFLRQYAIIMISSYLVKTLKHSMPEEKCSKALHPQKIGLFLFIEYTFFFCNFSVMISCSLSV